MKNIKFRIWNDDTKEWMTGSSKGIGGAQALGYASFLSEAVFPDYGAAYKDIFVEQYTGLKDRNGKEVYEGDLVANGTLTGIVEYKVDDFCAWTVGATTNGTVLLSGSWTVIGNVHENPELLKEGRRQLPRLRDQATKH